MEQNCDNCKDGPGAECDEVTCHFHPNCEIPIFWEPKEDEEEETPEVFPGTKKALDSLSI